MFIAILHYGTAGYQDECERRHRNQCIVHCEDGVLAVDFVYFPGLGFKFPTTNA